MFKTDGKTTQTRKWKCDVIILIAQKFSSTELAMTVLLSLKVNKVKTNKKIVLK